MLRKTRIFVIVFFIITIIVFVGYHFINFISTDRTIPVIQMEKDSITVPVEGGDKAILEGIKAMDEKDGDITENLFIESRSNFMEKGRFKVIIAVADQDNHVVKTEREVTYSNYRSPQFSLTGPLKFEVSEEGHDDLNIATNIYANDVIDGNISDKIRISSDYTISRNNPGDYHMEFIVTNSMGDTVKFPVTVTLYSELEEKGLPKIILSNYLINTPIGNGADVAGLIEQIEYHDCIYSRGEDGNFYNGEYDGEGNPMMFDYSSIVIDSNVDWNTSGVYEVKVTFTDEADGLSNFTRCYINIYE